MTRLIQRHFGLIVFLLYFAMELTVLIQGRAAGLFPPPEPGTDQLAMLQGAEKLVSGTLPGGDFRYSYAYTAFLALLTAVTGGNLIAMRVLQALLAAATPALIYHTARRLRIGRTGAGLAALLYCAYAPALLIGLDFLRAAPLGLAFLGFLYALLRGWQRNSGRWLAAAGLLGALCVLGRENFAPVVLLPLLYWCSPRVRGRLGFRRGAAFLAAAVLPVLAVMTFNALLYGSFQPVPGNAANIMRFYHGDSALTDRGAAALSLLRSVPVQFRAFLDGYELPNSLSFYAHRELIAALRMLPLPYHLLCALAFLGVWRFRRNGGVRLTFLLVCGYAGSLLFFTIFYRFRIPAMPLVALLAGGGAATLIELVRRRRYRPLAAAGALLAGYLLLTGGDADARRTFAERSAVTRLLIELERFDEAETMLNDLHGRGHDVRAGALLLARRRYAAGDRAGAEATLRRLAPPAGAGAPRR